MSDRHSCVYALQADLIAMLSRSVSCPPRDKVLQPFVGTEPELFDLFDYRGAIDVRPWTEEADDWEDNDV